MKAAALVAEEAVVVSTPLREVATSAGTAAAIPAAAGVRLARPPIRRWPAQAAVIVVRTPSTAADPMGHVGPVDIRDRAELRDQADRDNGPAARVGQAEPLEPAPERSANPGELGVGRDPPR